MILTASIAVPSNLKIKSIKTENEESISIDYGFIKWVTEQLSSIVNNSSLLDHGIAKGRAFATVGERKAAEYIEDWMIKNCSLPNSDVYKDKITNIDYPLKPVYYNLNLTTKLEVTEKKLSYYN